MQHATEAIGAPFSRPLRFEQESMYVYDIDHRSGLAMPTLQIADIAGVAAKVMGEALVCPVATGACVSSTTGGEVVGWDMYGQLVKETVAAAGTSKIAFAGLTSSPADAVWANQYGLPYKYSAAAATPNADVTITASAADGDSRGTFTFGGTLVDTDPPKYTEVQVPYMVDMSWPFGEAYAPRYETAAAVAAQTFAATIDNTGAIAITQIAITNDDSAIVYQFPDGGQITQAAGAATVNYMLSPLWLDKYRRAQELDMNEDGLVRAATIQGTHVKVDLTGTIARSAPTPPQPAPVAGSWTGGGTTGAALNVAGGPLAADMTVTIGGLSVDGTALPDVTVPVHASDTAHDVAVNITAALDNHMDTGNTITLHATISGNTVNISATGSTPGNFDTDPTFAIA